MANVNKNIAIGIGAKDNATPTLKKIGEEAKKTGQEAKGMGGMLDTALNAAALFAGAAGLGSMISAIEDSRKELSQARFFVAGYTKNVDGAMASIEAYGNSMQKTYGVGGEYASLIAARLLPRMKNMEKAQRTATVLLRGQRLGLMDAQDASIMLMRATDGNERALRYFAEQLGMTISPLANTDTIIEQLARRFTEAEKGLDTFATQWAVLKENIGDMLENAGTPIVAFLGWLFKGINGLVEKFPILGAVGSAALVTIGTALLAVPIMSLISSVIALGIPLATLGIAAGVLAGAIFAVAAAFIYWDDIVKFFQPVIEWWNNTALPTLVRWFNTYLAPAIDLVRIAFRYAGEAMASAWDNIKAAMGRFWEMFGPVILPALKYLGILLIGTVVVAIAAVIAVITGLIVAIAKVIEGITWFIAKFMELAQYSRDLWANALADLALSIKAAWEGIKAPIEAVINWINDKVNAVFNAISRVTSAASSATKGAVSAVSNFVTGKRAAGGPMTGGEPYLVGERGPEIVVPSGSSMVVPTHRLASAGAGGPSINIDMRGSNFLSRDAAVEVGDLIMKRMREVARIGAS